MGARSHHLLAKVYDDIGERYVAVSTEGTLAVRLFEFADASEDALYYAALTERLRAPEVVATADSPETEVASGTLPWSVFTSQNSEYAFAVVSGGAFIICAGPPDRQAAEQAIDDCLELLHVPEALDVNVSRGGPTSQIDLEEDLPSPLYDEDDDGASNSTVDKATRQQLLIHLALQHPPRPFDRLRELTAERAVDITADGDEIFIDDESFSGVRSPGEEYTIAFGRDGMLIFTGETLTGYPSILGAHSASISDSGTAIVAGTLQQSRRSGDSADARGEPDLDERDNPGADAESMQRIAFYAPDGELLHQRSTPSEILDAAISADGTHAAVLTEESRTRITLRMYDVAERTMIWEHETRDEHPSQLGARKEAVTFDRAGGQGCFMLSETPRDAPTYAVDLAGEIVWRTDETALRDDISALLTKYREPEKDVPSLEGTYDSRDDVTRTLEDIAARHIEAFDGHTDALVATLEAEAVPTGTDAQERVGESLRHLCSELGGEPELVQPHLDELIDLLKHRTPAVARHVAEWLHPAAEAEGLQRELVNDFDALLEQSPVPGEVVRVCTPVLDELLREDPGRAERIAETIRHAESLRQQRLVFKSLRSNIKRQMPDAVREPLVEVTARLYLDLCDLHQEAINSEGKPWSYEGYNPKHHSDVARVLAGLLDLRPSLIDDLIEPLLHQGLKADGPAKRTPGRPSRLLSVCCLVDETRVRARLNEVRDTLKRFVTETTERASVDFLFCLGEGFAWEQLERIAADEQLKSGSWRQQRLPDRAAMALELRDREVTVEPSVEAVDLSETRDITETLVHHRAMRVRAQSCVTHLRTTGSAMRRDFEAAVAEEGDPVFGEFEEWWGGVRWILKQLPEVTLDGHTYVYGDD